MMFQRAKPCRMGVFRERTDLGLCATRRALGLFILSTLISAGGSGVGIFLSERNEMAEDTREPFNPAFKHLRRWMKKAQKRRKRARPAPPTEKGREQNDEKIFLEAMKGVSPLNDDRMRVPRTPKRFLRPSHSPPNGYQEAVTHLEGLIRGTVEMDMTFTDEYMEGHVKGLNRGLIKKLKRGEFPVKDFIDLHGMTRLDAEQALGDFLFRSYRSGVRCVLVVHGRGLNSPDSFPVLKEGLPQWLGKGTVRKIVLAFATARPYDGGTGAVYVLLRGR